jgi:large subunit ribosomal protein L17
VRRAASLLPTRAAVRTLFTKVAPAVGERPGGFTRILRLGTSRLGDRAPQALLMLVDTPIDPEAEAAAAEAASADAGKTKKRGKKAKAEEAAATP